MAKVETLETAFYLRYSFTYWLEHIETGKVIQWGTKLGGSPTVFTNTDAARAWLQEKDESRVDLEKLERLNTKWRFAGWIQVETKAILTNQPMLGNGLLPDLLRNTKGLFALDTYDDNLCLFRCTAVHQGARLDRCTEKAKRLAETFYGDDGAKRFPKFELIQLKKVEEKFKFGIRVYEPSEDST